MPLVLSSLFSVAAAARLGRVAIFARDEGVEGVFCPTMPHGPAAAGGAIVMHACAA